MNEKNEPNLLDTLLWLGTTLEKNNDVLMMLLKNANSEDADLLDFAHNTKHLLLNELSEEEFTTLYAEFREFKDEN